MVFPPRCAGCGDRGGHFCRSCQDGLAWISPPVCVRCGVPLGDEGTGARESRRGPLALCPACCVDPPAYQHAQSLAVYAGSLREAIRGLKYRRRRVVGLQLGALLAERALGGLPSDLCAVVPVPLHPVRLRERGFNQAELLAVPVARALEIPCLPAAIRRRGIEAQAGLHAVARRHNVVGAFVPGSERVWGKVLLVDDVFSTGATAGACAQVLLSAGAGQVIVLTLARAVLRHRLMASGPTRSHESGLRDLPALLDVSWRPGRSP